MLGFPKRWPRRWCSTAAVRRSVRGASALIGAVAALSGASAGLAHAEPVVPVSQFCTPTELKLEELSGLALAGDVVYAVGDSGTDDAVAVLDRECVVQRWIPVPADPYDVEDLAIGPNGTLWLSDTGDNRRSRATIALTSMDPETGTGALHRLSYPDGAHDAETLLIQRDGTPLIVTKELFGPSGVYRPAGGAIVDGLASPGPMPLERVGELTIAQPTEVAQDSTMFTGGAVSADGTVAAVRTYSDVYLFAAPDGDIGKALTQGMPVRVALPNQPQGEALAFDAQGNLLIGSEARDGPLPPIQVLGVAELLEQDSAAAQEAGSDASGFSGPAIAAAAAAIVLVLVVAFVLRRRTDPRRI